MSSLRSLRICRAIARIGLVFIACSALASSEPSGKDIFERLKALAGEWEGTYEWSQGRTDKGTLKATYYVTGNGSAVVENLIMGDPPVPMMTTVYHLDGVDLRMTHFCAARNQPRLKASRIDESAADFSFVDVTNATVSPAYVNAFHIDLSDPRRLNLKFTFGGGSGHGAIENIVLKRVGDMHQ